MGMKTKTSTKPKPKKVRINVEVSPAARERLERLRDRDEDASLTDVVKKALAIYSFLIEHERAGGKIVLSDADGKNETMLMKFAFVSDEE